MTVGDVLSDKQKWHKRKFADPIEPDYHDDNRIARAYLAGPGRPCIHSFAHGGCTYQLSGKPDTIRIVPGQRFDYMTRMANVLQERGELYRRGGQLIAITPEGKFEVQTEHHVLTIFDRTFRFESYKNQKWNACDPGAPLAKQFCGAYSQSFPRIKALVTAPIINPTTRRLISQPGYDADSGVFAALPEYVYPVNYDPKLADIELAIKIVWCVVHLFPFAKPIDETVMFTAMLTAALRPLLPTAPGFAFDAAVQASGKTLLTKVLSELMGVKPAMTPYPGPAGETEIQKTLFTVLIEGSPVIVFDNVLGAVDSPSIASVLTGEDVSGRILGKSQSSTVTTNALLLMSGNNMVLEGDLPRRILKCRIDPRVEKPHQRSFPFDPVKWACENRQQIVSAILTLFIGFFRAGQHPGVGKGRVASFEVWDAVIRQTVCWLADLQRQGAIGVGMAAVGHAMPRLVDPIEAIDEAVAADPVGIQLQRLLIAWAATVGTGIGKRTTAKNVALQHGFRTSPGTVVNDPDAPSLKEVIGEVAMRKDEICPRRLGQYLASVKNRIRSGLAFREGPSYQNAATWWVEEVGESGESGESLSGDPKNNNVIPIKRSKKALTKLTKLTKSNTAQAPTADRAMRSKLVAKE